MRGQGLVEFALVLPVLILSLLIVIDFGRLFMSYVTLNNVVRIAANYGSTDPKSFTGTPNITNYDAVIARESAGLNCSLRADGAGNNPPIPVVPPNPPLGSMSVATMTCDFSLVTPIIGRFFGNSGTLPITATSQFPIRTGAINNISGGTTLPPPGSPVAAFSFSGVSGGTIDGSGNVTGTAPVSVNGVDGSSNAQTWEWDWGDGTTHEFTQVPLPHQFNGANTYVVRLTVTNTLGSSSTTHTVAVSSVSAPPPVAGFYGTPTAAPPAATGGGSGGAAIEGSNPLVVNFTNISTSGTAYSWDFGDGTTASTQVAPQHQFSKLGVFTVTLSITAPTGGTPFTRSNYLTVGCVVPNFANTSTSTADSLWSSAGFTGSVSYHNSATNKTNPNPPGSAANITSQSIAGGTFEPPTKKGSNPYTCDYDITVNY